MKHSESANHQIGKSPIRNRQSPIILALAALLLLASIALAQGGYDLSWWTVDGGGATLSSGGGYTLGGSIGQPDAGALSGGDYELQSGFWYGVSVAAAVTDWAYLPVIVKSF
jgi:hypothetical protein